MSQFDQHIQGSYTSDGKSRNIFLPSDVDYFELRNDTQMNSTANPGKVKKAYWQRGLADKAAWVVKNTNGAAADESSKITANGFQVVKSADDLLGNAVNGTAINQANPAVLSTADTSMLQNGDQVLLAFTTGMLQVNGIVFTIDNIVANTSFELKYLDSSGFAAPATNVVFRKVNFPELYKPKVRTIVSVTKGTSTVVKFSADHGYVVGGQVKFNIAQPYGMVELNDKVGTITAVDLVNNTITVNIDSSGFTNFAFPTSANASVVSLAQAVPVGELPNTVNFGGAFQRNGFISMNIGSAVAGEDNDKVYWRAVKSMSVFNS